MRHSLIQIAFLCTSSQTLNYYIDSDTKSKMHVLKWVNVRGARLGSNIISTRTSIYQGFWYANHLAIEIIAYSHHWMLLLSSRSRICLVHSIQSNIFWSILWNATIVWMNTQIHTSMQCLACCFGLKKNVPSTSGYLSKTSIGSSHKMHETRLRWCWANEDKMNRRVSSLPWFPSSSICKLRKL